MIDTNLDFDEMNRSLNGEGLSAAHLLAHIQTSRADVFFGASSLSEIVVGPSYSSLIEKRYFDLAKRREKSIEQHDLFESVFLTEGRAVREAINSGERTFAEFLKLLDEAEKFREWLHSADYDAQLAQEYASALAKDTWLNQLPGKATRFSMFTGAGVFLDLMVPTGLGTLAGIGIGAVDNFVFERLAGGWRPNMFVQGPLKRFGTNSQ